MQIASVIYFDQPKGIAANFNSSPLDSPYLFGNLPPLLMHSAIVANGVKFSVLA